MEGICNTGTITRLLEENHLAPLKKFGQNFLRDANIVKKIAAAALEEGENILEIGPGLGALTDALACRASKVVAVEIDHGMIGILGQTLAGRPNVTVVEGDILKTDIAALCREQFGSAPLRVAGNLPYYITSKCLLAVLESGANVRSLTAMVQKEVAERLAAAPGTAEYGALTASVAYYGGAKLLFNVPAGCFLPQPDVESAVVRIEVTPAFEVERAAYTRAVRTLFAMRRKTVQNNLRAAGMGAAGAAALLERAGIDPLCRAETLAPADFARLAALF